MTIDDLKHAPPRRTGLTPLLGALVCLWSSVASSQQPASKPIECSAHKGSEVRCDLHLTDFFDSAVKEKMRSGLLNRFHYRVYIRRVQDGEPVALAAMRLLEVYELWDEVYFVLQQDGGDTTRKSQHLEGAIGHLAEIDALLIARGLPPGRYYADLFVEINPLSEEDEAELRAWISRSRGGQSTFATGDRSFFGTFVSLFTNIRPGKAERTFRAQTAPFTLKPP